MADQHPGAQNAGSAFIMALSLLLYVVAALRRLSGIRREALALVATYLAFAVLVRVCITRELLTQVEGRIINGWTAGVFAAVLSYVIVTALLARRSQPR